MNEDINLDRLAILIDPTTSTRLYSQRKILGPILTRVRTGLVKLLYFIFRLDFSRLIELHQNVWVMAYQLKETQKRVEQLELQIKKIHEEKNQTHHSGSSQLQP